jgi:hypothetical protein
MYSDVDSDWRPTPHAYVDPNINAAHNRASFFMGCNQFILGGGFLVIPILTYFIVDAYSQSKYGFIAAGIVLFLMLVAAVYCNHKYHYYHRFVTGEEKIEGVLKDRNYCLGIMFVFGAFILSGLAFGIVGACSQEKYGAIAAGITFFLSLLVSWLLMKYDDYQSSQHTLNTEEEKDDSLNAQSMPSFSNNSSE